MTVGKEMGTSVLQLWGINCGQQWASGWIYRLFSESADKSPSTNTLISALWDPSQRTHPNLPHFWPIQLWASNGCCFRSLSLFICYSSNERLIQIPTLRSFSYRIMWIPDSKTQLSLLHSLLQFAPLLRRSWFQQLRHCSSKSGSDKRLGVEGS